MHEQVVWLDSGQLGLGLSDFLCPLYNHTILVPTTRIYRAVLGKGNFIIHSYYIVRIEQIYTMSDGIATVFLSSINQSNFLTILV